LAVSVNASTGLRYGTLSMSSPDFLMKECRIRSVAPVIDAQLSFPGCARAIANSSFSELTLSEDGTLIEIKVELTRATGERSRGS
jgi:hypothetical protein